MNEIVMIETCNNFCEQYYFNVLINSSIFIFSIKMIAKTKRGKVMLSMLLSSEKTIDSF